MGKEEENDGAVDAASKDGDDLQKNLKKEIERDPALVAALKKQLGMAVSSERAVVAVNQRWKDLVSAEKSEEESDESGVPLLLEDAQREFFKAENLKKFQTLDEMTAQLCAPTFPSLSTEFVFLVSPKFWGETQEKIDARVHFFGLMFSEKQKALYELFDVLPEKDALMLLALLKNRLDAEPAALGKSVIGLALKRVNDPKNDAELMANVKVIIERELEEFEKKYVAVVETLPAGFSYPPVTFGRLSQVADLKKRIIELNQHQDGFQLVEPEGNIINRLGTDTARFNKFAPGLNLTGPAGYVVDRPGMAEKARKMFDLMNDYAEKKEDLELCKQKLSLELLKSFKHLLAAGLSKEELAAGKERQTDAKQVVVEKKFADVQSEIEDYKKIHAVVKERVVAAQAALDAHLETAVSSPEAAGVSGKSGSDSVKAQINRALSALPGLVQNNTAEDPGLNPKRIDELIDEAYPFGVDAWNANKNVEALLTEIHASHLAPESSKFKQLVEAAEELINTNVKPNFLKAQEKLDELDRYVDRIKQAQKKARSIIGTTIEVCKKTVAHDAKKFQLMLALFHEKLIEESIGQYADVLEAQEKTLSNLIQNVRDNNFSDQAVLRALNDTGIRSVQKRVQQIKRDIESPEQPKQSENVAFERKVNAALDNSGALVARQLKKAQRDLESICNLDEKKEQDRKVRVHQGYDFSKKKMEETAEKVAMARKKLDEAKKEKSKQEVKDFFVQQEFVPADKGLIKETLSKHLEKSGVDLRPLVKKLLKWHQSLKVARRSIWQWFKSLFWTSASDRLARKIHYHVFTSESSTLADVAGALIAIKRLAVTKPNTTLAKAWELLKTDPVFNETFGVAVPSELPVGAGGEGSQSTQDPMDRNLAEVLIWGQKRSSTFSRLEVQVPQEGDAKQAGAQKSYFKSADDFSKFFQGLRTPLQQCHGFRLDRVNAVLSQ